MQRKNWAMEDCPMARTVALIGEWGSLMILREAFGGMTRFDELQAALQISRHLLTTRLKKLVEGGVLERRPIAEGAKRHEYVLTEMGEDLVTTIVAIRQWGDRWLFAPGPAPAAMYDASDGTRLAKLEAKSAKGHVVSRSEIRLKATRKK